MLINGYICQMHAEVIKILLVRLLIGNSCKPCQSVLINIDPWRIHPKDDRVNTQIVLQVVDQVRLVDIALHDALVFRLDPRRIPRQKDTATLTLIIWLHYESPGIFMLLQCYVFREIFKIMRHHVRFRKEIVLLGHQSLHLVQSATKHVLFGNDVHPWKMINTLMKLHILQELKLRWPIVPGNVPITALLLRQVILTKDLTSLLHDGVVRITTKKRDLGPPLASTLGVTAPITRKVLVPRPLRKIIIVLLRAVEAHSGFVVILHRHLLLFVLHYFIFLIKIANLINLIYIFVNRE